MNAIASPDVKPPDLTLKVTRGERSLRYHLSGRLLTQDVADEVTLEKELGPDLGNVDALLNERLGLDGQSTEDDRRAAHVRLRSFGVNLGRNLVPPSIHQALLRLVPGKPALSRPAPTLLIVADEPSIRWELVALTTAKRSGPFLGEAFAVSRWGWDRPLTLCLPLERPALMVSTFTGLADAEAEGRAVEDFWAERGLEARRVAPSLIPLLEAFASSDRDGWHLIGHGKTDRENPHLWEISLSDRRSLQASDLADPQWSFRRSRPLVFLNACRSAVGQLSSYGEAGIARAFTEAGAGAVIGTSWVVTDALASFFSLAFYREYLDGQPLAEAVRRARLALRDAPDHLGDPTWLAFSVLGHPRAQRTSGLRPAPPIRRDEPTLVVPDESWQVGQYPPGALLQAQFGIVPFHRREAEIDELWRWCDDATQPISVRLYTGPGGMGKTRLALEHCQRLRNRGWRTGFIPDDSDPDDVAGHLLAHGAPVLAVIDYAASRRPVITTVLNRLAAQGGAGPYRFILLDRLREEWWEQLRTERGAAGGLLSNAAVTQHDVLRPLAHESSARLETYDIAGRAFSSTLDRPRPSAAPKDIEAGYFEPVLMLHMSALGAVHHGGPIEGEDEILDWVLDREKRFWTKGLRVRELPRRLLPGVGRAMAAFTLAGGAESRGQATGLIEALKFFRGEPQSVIESVADLLHGIYPGREWIMPVLPDILGEHLIERELVHDEQEIFDLVLGPRDSPEEEDEPDA